MGGTSPTGSSFNSPVLGAIAGRTVRGTDLRLTARHDFWNIALSTMALHQVLFDDNQFPTQLAEVQAALDLVFPLFRDGFESGDVTAWSSSLGS